MNISLKDAATSIVTTGQFIHSRGWVPATSGNFSQRLDADSVAITVSGTDKGNLTVDDVMQINLDGVSASGKKSSAETALHLQLYRRDPEIGAVLHTHSVNATVCSQRAERTCDFAGLELLKAFAGINTHESSLSIPVFDNTQDIPTLAAAVEKHMSKTVQGHGYLIRGHGLYTWGLTMSDCLRHLEALEYLFEYHILSNGTESR